MFFMGVGGGIAFMVAEVPPENKSMATLFGLAFILIGVVLGGLFAWLALALSQRKRLAYRFACGLSNVYLRSPLFFLGMMALGQLGQDAVLQAFGIEE